MGRKGTGRRGKGRGKQGEGRGETGHLPHGRLQTLAALSRSSINHRRRPSLCLFIAQRGRPLANP